MTHTPGPWTWWTSNSWRRLRHDDRGKSADVLMPTTQHGDGHPDILASEEDMALVAAAPDLLAACDLARIALKNRDQSEYEVKVLLALKYAIAKATTPVSR